MHSIGSVTVFGISAIAHVVFLAAIVLTVATFETAKRGGFNLRLEHKTNGYHTQAEQDICITTEKELNLTQTTLGESMNRRDYNGTNNALYTTITNNQTGDRLDETKSTLY